MWPSLAIIYIINRMVYISSACFGVLFPGRAMEVCTFINQNYEYSRFYFFCRLCLDCILSYILSVPHFSSHHLFATPCLIFTSPFSLLWTFPLLRSPCLSSPFLISWWTCTRCKNSYRLGLHFL